jgi:hypothetical protein
MPLLLATGETILRPTPMWKSRLVPSSRVLVKPAGSRPLLDILEYGSAACCSSSTPARHLQAPSPFSTLGFEQTDGDNTASFVLRTKAPGSEAAPRAIARMPTSLSVDEGE